MPKAKKTKSGKYTISVYDYKDINGIQHYKRFTASTKKEVELLAARYKNGEVKEKPKINQVTLKQSLEEYIELRKSVISPSSIRGYLTIQRTLLKDFPDYMNKPIDDITQTDLQFIVSQLSVDKSPKTVKNHITLILALNSRFKEFKLTLPTIYHHDLYIPTEAEILTLLDACKGTEIEVPIMLGAYCMMRRGEICSLTIRDVDFKNKTIHIKHSIVRDLDNEWILKPPKTRKSDRVIKVPDFVLKAIKEKGCITTLLPDQLTERFERKIRSLGLTPFRFHDLRHYACSMFFYRNAPINFIKDYGGWELTDTVMRIYQHTLRDKEDEIYSSINNYFEKTVAKHN